MLKKLEPMVLRHIVPFYFEEGMSYDNICEKLSADPLWEAATVETEAEQDIYKYLLDEFQNNSLKSNIGATWKYNDSEKLTLAYLKNPTTYVSIKVINTSLFLFRSGIGFLWYELSFNSAAFSKEELISFQNAIKELNRYDNLKKIYRIQKEDVRFKVTLEDFCTIDSEEKKTAVQCIAKGGPMYLRKSSIPAFTGGIETAVRYQVLNYQDEWQVKYCGCSSFSLGDWIATLLEQLPCKVAYFAGRKNCLCKDESGQHPAIVPDKAILFSYALAEANGKACAAEDYAETAQYAYYITNGYNKNYLYHERYVENMYRPFQNIFWNISKEGCGCFVCTPSGKQTFFKDGLKSKVISDYFVLYILLLHQSYTLLRYAQLIAAGLPADDKEYLEESALYHETMENLTSKLNAFLVKGAYASVSHIQHQNGFYQYGLKRLNIKEDVQSVTMGLEALADIQRIKHQEQQEAKEKIEENNLTIGLGLLSLLAIFSAFADASGFIEKLGELLGWTDTKEMAAVCVFYVLVGMVGAVAIFRFIRACYLQSKEKRKLKNKK